MKPRLVGPVTKGSVVKPLIAGGAVRKKQNKQNKTYLMYVFITSNVRAPNLLLKWEIL